MKRHFLGIQEQKFSQDEDQNNETIYFDKFWKERTKESRNVCLCFCITDIIVLSANLLSPSAEITYYVTIVKLCTILVSLCILLSTFSKRVNTSIVQKVLILMSARCNLEFLNIDRLYFRSCEPVVKFELGIATLQNCIIVFVFS